MAESNDGENGKGMRAPFLLGALAGLGALFVVAKRKKLRPYLRSGFREAYAFKEWVALHADEAREDFEDIAAEAKQEYRNDLKRRLEGAEKQAGLLKRLFERNKKGEASNG